MHRHDTTQSTKGCSRFCAANAADREYYQRHHHYADEAPVQGCLSCDNQKRAMEEKRTQQERLLRAKER